MKQLFLITMMMTVIGAIAQAQYRGSEPQLPSVSENVVAPSGNGAILGFLYPENLTMSHSVSMSYSSFGNQNMGLTMYTNTLRYKISGPLSLRADVSMVYSPFNSLPQSMQNSINGVYLQNAQLDYQPSKDFKMSLQFRQAPYSLYYDSYDPLWDRP